MRTLLLALTGSLLALALCAAIAVPAPTQASKGTIAGFAFVTSQVSSMGSRAKLQEGTKIYPSGSTLTGTEGCATNRYHTDGIPVVVIDYEGRPTAGNVQVTRHPARGGNFTDPPYYMDIDPGRIVQNLGPIFENGTYDVVFTWDYSRGKPQMTSAKFTLNRRCQF